MVLIKQQWLNLYIQLMYKFLQVPNKESPVSIREK